LSDHDTRRLFDLAAVDDCDMIVSTRVRVARNLEEYSYAATLTKGDRLKVEDEIVQGTKMFTGDIAGEYTYLKDIPDDKQKEMVANHLLFHNLDLYIKEAGMFDDWPNGRGVFMSHKKDFMVWVNEEDHMRVISLQKGNDLLACYGRLVNALDVLGQQVKLDKGMGKGYMASCPTNLGTGMRASVHIKIPLTSQMDGFSELCRDMRIDIRGIHGEHSESVGGIFDISNCDRYGLTEKEALGIMCRGVKNLIRIEKALQKASSAKK